MIVSLLALSGMTISIENPGVRLKIFLKEVSHQTGQEHRCSSSLENEVLVASFKDQSINVLKVQLGRVIHASWTESEGIWTLAQTSDEKHDEQLLHRDQRRQLIELKLASLRALAPHRELNIDDINLHQRYVNGQYEGGQFRPIGVEGSPKTYQELEQEKPTFRLAARLSTILKPEDFDLDEFASNLTTYSSSANLEGITPLRVNYKSQLDQFEREDALFRATAPSGTVASPPFQLVIHNNMEAISIVDRNWKQVNYCQLHDPKLVNVDFEPESFTLSPETQKLNDLANHYFSFADLASKPEISRAWDIFRNADTKDPLGIVHGQCWLEFAHYAQKPMLASLSDGLASTWPRACVPKAKQIKYHSGVTRLDKDGWILAAPCDPLEARVRRIDRSLVKRAADVLLSAKRPSIDEEAELSSIKMLAFLRKQNIPNWTYLPAGQGGYFLLPMFGYLPPELRARARTGFSVPVSSLPSPAIDVVRNMRDIGILDNFNLQHLPNGESSYFPLYRTPDPFSGMQFEANSGSEIIYTVINSSRTMYLPTDQFDMYLRNISSQPKFREQLASLKIRVDRCGKLLLRMKAGAQVMEENILESPQDISQTYSWETLPPEFKKLLTSTGIGG